MDDLKVYAAGPRLLRDALRLTDWVSKDVGMELGLAKCAVAHLFKGEEGGVTLSDQRVIPALNPDNPYKYLGIFGPNLAAVRERLTKTYVKRLYKIWRSELNAKNKVRATNKWAVSIFRYYFGILKWTEKQVKELDLATRRILRSVKCHQYGASNLRLTSSDRKGVGGSRVST